MRIPMNVSGIFIFPCCFPCCPLFFPCFSLMCFYMAGKTCKRGLPLCIFALSKKNSTAMWQKPFILHCLHISNCRTGCYDANYSNLPFSLEIPVFIGIPGEYMKDEGKTSYRISKFWYSCYLRSWYDCFPDHWNLDLIFCLPKALLCPD